LGKEEVQPGVEVALHRRGDSLILTFDDTGVFEVSGDGRRIGWTPPADPDLEAVRKDVLGRVLAVALHQEGVITLHGSAVELGGVAVAFLAPKYHGKSTTAATLVESGARLLADDLVAVSPGPDPSVMPSVPRVQLWSDSAERMARASGSVRGDERAPKLQVGWNDPARTASTAAPLSAVYLLTPVRPETCEEVRRDRVPIVEATLALLGQAKIGGLLGVRQRSELLQRMGDLAERVPVYRLLIPRDFERLSELTSRLWGWHP
jgi:hypothetical protein